MESPLQEKFSNSEADDGDVGNAESKRKKD